MIRKLPGLLILLMIMKNNVKQRSFHLLNRIIRFISLSVFILLIFNVIAYAAKREVRVGVYANKPLVYQDGNGEHKGLSIDVLRYIASKENWKLEFVPCSWPECLEMLKKGENDIQVIIARTPEREKIYDFTKQALYSIWAQIYIHPKANIESIKDLEGKNVVLYKGSLLSEKFKTLIGGFDISCNLIEVGDYESMFTLIQEKKADAGVFIQTVAEKYANRGIVRRTSIMFSPVPLYYAFPKGKVAELTAAVDYHLKAMKEDRDSIYYQSLEEIFGMEKRWKIPYWIKWTLIVAISLMLLFLIVSVILRRQVKARTSELVLKNTELEMEIAERKQAKDDLIRSENKFRELFNNANDAIYLWELREDGMAGRCIEVNDVACLMLGYTKDELLAMTPMDINAKESVSKIPGIMNELLDKGHTTFEMIHRKKDGSKIPVEISSHIYSFEGEKVLLSITRDITERRNLEEELNKAHKLESIGIFAGGIAHDFNNLLSGILNNVYLSKMNIDSKSKSHKNLESAEKAINRATNLTQQLLTFSIGGAPIKKTTSIVEIFMESAEFALRGSNVSCEYNVVDNLWPVEVDEGQINQVIHNLILNAAQSMSQGGKILILIENSELAPDNGLLLKGGRYVTVKVKDHGIGIEKEQLIKIFDPYFTTKEMGRGLGLSITYSIIKQHDGLITVESELGVGTTFTIYLPASEKQVEEKEIVEDTPVTGEGRILLMDDEALIRDSVGEFLNHVGYDIECVSNGDRAIELYTEVMKTREPFDAVILDLTIPGGMGGKEVMKKLVEIDPDVKAIVSSGFSNDPVMANFKEYGFDAVFCKASDSPDDLCRILNKVITPQ